MKSYLFVFLFVTALGYSQKNTNIAYGALFNEIPFGEDYIIEYPEELEEFLQIKERAKELTFILKINEDRALFIHPQVDEDDWNLFMAYQSTAGDYSYFTDFDKNEQVVQFPYWGAEIYIENKINGIPWKLTNESKKIENYTCFKATKEFVVNIGGFKNTKKVEAWYTPEIPIKFGPKQYVGLPGLIIELKEDYITYFLKEINYQSKDQPAILPPIKGIKMTWEEFAKKSIVIKKTAKQAIIDGGR